MMGQVQAVAVTAGPTITDWLQAGGSIAMMIAAVTALVIAAKAPKWAAQWSETMRAQNAVAEEKRRLEMQVFTSLMARRATILHHEAIAALNLVDVVFAHNDSVRDAHKSFIAATTAMPHQADVTVERYHSLIASIARAVGLHDRITGADIRAGYYPSALGKLDEAAIAEAEEKIARRQLAQALGTRPN